MTQAVLVALAIVLPAGLANGPIDIAVSCRDASSVWSAPDWNTHAAPPKLVEGPEGRRCRVLARPRAASFHAVSREVLWARDAGPVHVESGWHRTVRADAPADNVVWLGVDDDATTECQSAGGRSECLFVPWEAAGLMLGDADGRRQVAIVDDGITTVSWRAGIGRLLRVHSPSTAPIEARALRLERSLRSGASHLLEPRVAPEIALSAVGRRAFWVSGTADRAFIEVRSGPAAPQRIAVASLTGPAEAPIDVRLWIGEVIEGDIRGRTGPVEAATVILSRIVGDGGAPVGEEERPRERIAEMVTDESGRFRFTGLTRDRHELLALHPVQGRVRRIVTPPEYPRLMLRPRSRIRGRILRNGIPVSAALVQVHPSLDAVAAARNPLLLAGVSARSAADGRFEINAPDQDRFVLAISSSDGSARVDFGDAAALSEIVELGDIRLEEPLSVELTADIPAGCTLQAAGPMGSSGLSIVSAIHLGGDRWRFNPPLVGRWLFAAVCGPKELPLEPAVVDVPPSMRQPVVLRVRR